MLEAAERREIVPIGFELRALAWLGVMLIATGVGIVIKKHFNDIGPLTIAIALAAVALACYVWVALKARRPLDEYIVLLGALLISADFAFVETQWHLLGNEWQRHFLILAMLHAATAYWFNSRAVLSLSIASLAAWFGIEQRNFADSVFNSDAGLALRAFACAGAIVLWRAVNRDEPFDGVFDQFAIHIAFWGSILFTINEESRYFGLILTLLLAVVVLRLGFRRRRELFVMYAFVYTIIAIDIVIVDAIHDEVINVLYVLVSSVAAIVTLFAIHVRFQKRLADA